MRQPRGRYFHDDLFLSVYRCCRESAHWPVVEGRLISGRVASYGNSTIGSRTDAMPTALRRQRPRCEVRIFDRRKRLYRPQIFARAQIARPRILGGEGRHYIAGAQVSVHYNPDDHSDAVIETGSTAVLYFYCDGHAAGGYGGYESFRILRKSSIDRTSRN